MTVRTRPSFVGWKGEARHLGIAKGIKEIKIASILGATGRERGPLSLLPSDNKMSAGTLRAEAPDTPASEQVKGNISRQPAPATPGVGSWKGIITPGCQDGTGVHCLPKM